MRDGDSSPTGGVDRPVLGNSRSLPTPASVAFSVAIGRGLVRRRRAEPVSVADAGATEVAGGDRREDASRKYQDTQAATVVPGENRTQRGLAVGTDLPDCGKKGRPGGRDPRFQTALRSTVGLPGRRPIAMNNPRHGPRPPDGRTMTQGLLRPTRGPGGFCITLLLSHKQPDARRQARPSGSFVFFRRVPPRSILRDCIPSPGEGAIDRSPTLTVPTIVGEGWPASAGCGFPTN